MTIREPMVDMLVDINPHVCQDFVRYENEKSIYVEMKKAVYRMLQCCNLLSYTTKNPGKT
jgi:hypothetical protein